MFRSSSYKDTTIVSLQPGAGCGGNGSNGWLSFQVRWLVFKFLWKLNQFCWKPTNQLKTNYLQYNKVDFNKSCLKRLRVKVDVISIKVCNSLFVTEPRTTGGLHRHNLLLQRVFYWLSWWNFWCVDNHQAAWLLWSRCFDPGMNNWSHINTQIPSLKASKVTP